jgi:sulfur carrier protein ThiS adenylyltransferase
MNSPEKNSFDSIIRHYFTPDQLAKIRRTHIGIAGAGGLGSNCAHALVRCGFEKFTIVDFDVIEPSNLNRQFYFPDQIGRPKVEALKENLRRINPEITIKTFQIKLDRGNMPLLFDPCQVIVEAFDKAEMKAAIVECFANSDKFMVTASGLAGYGKSDRIKSKKLRANLILIGDGRSSVSETLKPLAPCVYIAAAKQADAVLEWTLQSALSP